MPDHWVIWSYEHDAWWGPHRTGYYPSLFLAGLYTKEVAQNIEANCQKGDEKAMCLADGLLFEVKRWRPHYETEKIVGNVGILADEIIIAGPDDYLLRGPIGHG